MRALSMPLLQFELIGTARRQRYIWLRCVFAGLLLLVLFLLYVDQFGQRQMGWKYLVDPALSSAEMPLFASRFFQWFLGAQLAAILLLGPAYVAAAIAGEKQQRTLECLLTTDLTDGEIILTKLAARVANLLLLTITSLPILALLPLLGGVDPELVVCGGVLMILTVVSIGALSLAASVHQDRPLDAMSLAYLWVIGIVACWFPGCNLLNPLAAIGFLQTAGEQRWSLLVAVGVLHLTIAAAACAWAIGNLRHYWQGRAAAKAIPATPRPASGKEVIRPARVKPPPRHYRPPIWGEHPLLWKELLAEQEFSWRKLHPAVAIAGIASGSLTLFVLVLSLAADRQMRETYLELYQVLGAGASTAILLAVAFAAASTFSREREQGTLDGLLTLPVERSEILRAKWLGSVLSVRWAAWGLLLIWSLGMLSGVLRPLGVLLQAVSVTVFAACLAGLGILLSLRCRTNLRAVLWTLGIVLGVWGGCWFLCAQARLYRLFLSADASERLREVFAACSMPLDLWMALSATDSLLVPLAGLAAHTWAAAILYWFCLKSVRTLGHTGATR